VGALIKISLQRPEVTSPCGKRTRDDQTGKDTAARTMNIPRMPGMGGGNPGAPAGDTPQVDTAEQVQISSLALLKMLKHGEYPLGVVERCGAA
jgi:hypothetical protein